MPNKKINQLDSRVLSATDLLLIGDPTTGTSFKSLVSGLGLVYVPYTGATGDVNLGTHRILAQNATIASSGSGDTALINHTSGSGIALNITKGGNGEGLYVNKTSGSGNAATIIGTLNATNLVKSGGTSSQFLKADGSIDSSAYITGITSGNVTTALGFTPVPTTRTITINGTSLDLSADRSYTVAGMAIGGAITSATAGSVLFAGASGILAQNNANLFWDNTNGRLGIGTNAPTEKLQIVGGFTASANSFISAGSLSIFTTNTPRRLNLQVANGSKAAAIGIESGGVIHSVIGVDTSGNDFLQLASKSGISFYSGSTIGNIVTEPTNERMRLTTGGRLLLGSTSEGTQLLQVYGDAFIRGSGATSATSALLVQNSAGTQLLRLYNVFSGGASTGLDIGDGTIANTTAIDTQFGEASIKTRYLSVNSSGAILYISGGVGVGNVGLTTNRAAVNIGEGNYTLTGATQNNVVLSITGNFVPTSGGAGFVDLHIRPTINQTGGANGITRGLYVNPTLTAAADWRSIEWSNNTGWGLYGAGTANNFLNGNLGIGSTGLTNVNLRIEKNIEGSTGAYGVLLGGQIRSGVTSQALSYTSNPSIQNTAFTLSQLRHFYAVGISSPGSATIANQSGFYAETTLTGATNNYGFYGDIPNATNRWNLYMAGDADNYLRGKLLINTTSVGTFALDVNGTARVSGAMTFSVGTGVAGSISYGTTYGLTLYGNTGSSSDLLMTDRGGNLRFRIVNGGNIVQTSTTIDNISIGSTGQTSISGGSIYGMLIQGRSASTFNISLVENTGNNGAFINSDGQVKVGVFNSTYNSSAILEAVSTTKGFLPPRMTTAQKNAIGTPAAGLQVYDTTLNQMSYYNGTNWINF